MNRIQRIIRTFFLSLTISGLFIGCSSVPKTTLAIVGSVDTLTVREFEESYLRLRQSPPETKEQKQEFLDLLVDYRVKLQEAQRRGLQNEKDIQEELNQYRDQIAVSHLLDQRLFEPAIKTLYDRRLEQVNASHIFIRFDRDEANRIDTLSTYKKAMALLEKVLKSSEPFDTLIMRHSDDGTKNRTLGRTGWIIAGTSLPELDDLLYSMKVDEIAQNLFRSQFGYHIFKLTGRKNTRQRVRASQILYRLDLDNPTDTSAGYARLTLILDSLKRGLATFEDLARRNSQDPVSGAEGGDLGWLERGTNLEPRFEEAVFNLPKGEISPVVRSAFGLHIIKVTEESNPRTFEEQKADLKSIYRKERFTNDFRVMMKGLREKYEYRLIPEVVSMILSKVDTSATTSTPNWEARITEKEKDSYLFRLKDRVYYLRDAIKEIKTDPTLQMRSFSPSSIDTIAMTIADKLILVEETKDYEKKYPEVSRLLKEYLESALISRLEQNDVVSKVEMNEDAVRKYWKQHADEYQWPDRVSFSEIFVYSDKLAKNLLDSLKNGANFAELASRHTRRPGLFDKGGSWGFVPSNANELSREANALEVGEISDVIIHKIGYSIIKVDARESTRRKTYEEAKPELVGKVKEEMIQDAMRTWVQSLRDKYDVKVYPGHLENVFLLSE